MGDARAGGRSAACRAVRAALQRQGLPLPLRGARDQIDSLAFSSDGHSVFASNAEGEVLAWKDLLWANTADVRREVCDLVGAGLGHGEWSVFAPDVKWQKSCP